MIDRTLFLVLVLSLLATPLAAENDPVEAIAAIMADWDRSDSPGCAIGVVQDGQTVFQQGYGQANLDHGIPISPRTVFEIGSVSKHFTAAAVALLAQRGLLSLDDHVREHIPELPDYGKPVTVRHLVHHLSGLRPYYMMMLLGGGEDYDVHDQDEMMEVIVRQKRLNFAPGERYTYSNSGYVLLAEIVERVSGQEFGEFMEKNVFGPLGMSDSRIYTDASAVIPQRATGYAMWDGRLVVAHYYNWTVAGDGGVYTTVEDLTKWDRAFYEGSALGEGFTEQMYERGVLNDGGTTSYAFGLHLGRHKGLDIVHHGGGWGGFRAFLLRFPSERTSIFTLCNIGNIDIRRTAFRVADVFLANRYPGMEADEPGDTDEPAVERAVELTYQQMELLTGLYFDAENRSLKRILRGDEALVYSRGGDQKTDLEALGPRRFRMAGVGRRIIVSFEPEVGSAQTMLVQVDDEEPDRHDAMAQARYTDEELGAFAGEYRSDELDVVYRLVVEGSELWLHAAGRKEALEPGFIDYFTGPFPLPGAPVMSLEFQRDASGKVNGFILDALWLRGLFFERVESGLSFSVTRPTSPEATSIQ